ncbi:MAG: alkaline phosphatase [Candidatus Hydrogenedentes bacterium]|nr:alkaline phosphatase [Candidatus Hydrogenedentota bacterium]
MPVRLPVTALPGVPDVAPPRRAIAAVPEWAAAQGRVQRNVILMISDGCGFNHVLAADYYQHGAPDSQVYEQGFVSLAMSTYADGGSYSPEAIWGSFEECKAGATDSAAAATAMATGSKTYKGAIGLDRNKVRLVTAVEAAEAAGRATGVVTSVQLSHATPAGFVAHNENRNNYAEIAREMFLWSGLDVIMGGGNPWFDDDGRLAPIDWGAEDLRQTFEEQYEKVAGLETWIALTTGQAGNDADGDGIEDAWTLIQSREEFRSLAHGVMLPKRVAGVFRSVSTTQQKRTGVDEDEQDDYPYQTLPTSDVPTLAEMTLGALNVLGTDPDGFFLMVEGGAIDWASHANQLGRMIEEQVEFNQAVETAVQWIEMNGGWTRNLLIITADHECGYLTGPKSDPEQAPVVNNGRGRLPGAEWHHDGHTNQLVPFYARGAGSDLLRQRAVNHDPRRGPYLDNTDLGQVLLALLK